MDDTPLHIQSIVDIGDINSKFPAAAQLIDTSTGRMEQSFRKVQEASSKASKSLLVDWAGRPFDDAAAGALKLDTAVQQVTQTINLSTESIAELATALKSTGKEVEKTGSDWEKFAENVKEFIENPLKTAGATVKKFLVELGPAGTVAVAAGAGLAILGEKTFELVNEEGKAARETQNFANMLGLSFEQAKKLGEMAKLVDADVGGLARASFRLANALEDPAGAGKKAAEALHQLGVEATEAGPALLEVLQKLSEMPDRTQRIAVAHELLGRASFQLIPLIENYDKLSEAIENLGGKVSEEGVNSLLSAREKVQELDIAWSHLKEAVAAKLAPTVEIAIRAVTSLVTGGGKEPGKDEGSFPEWLKAGYKAPAPRSGFTGSPDLATHKGASGSRYNIMTGQYEPWAEQSTGTPFTMLGPNKALEAVQKISAEDAAKKAADAFKTANSGTLEGLKSAYEEAQKTVKDLTSKLSVPIADEAKRAEMQKQYNQALQQEASLKARIRSVEKAPELAQKQIEDDKKVAILRLDLYEQTAKGKYKLGLISIEEETAALQRAENARFEIEKAAALKLNALRAVHGGSAGVSIPALAAEHQKRSGAIEEHAAEVAKKEEEQQKEITDKWTEYQHKAMEKNIAEVQAFLLRDHHARVTEATTLAHILEGIELGHINRVYERSKEAVTAQYADKEITLKREIELLRQIEKAKYEAEMGTAIKEYGRAKDGGNPEDVAKAQGKIDEIADAYSVAMGRINNESRKSIVVITNVVDRISAEWATGIGRWVTGQERFGQSVRKIWDGIAQSIITNLIKAGAQMLVSAALHQAISKKNQIIEAKEAAVSAYKGVIKAVPVPLNFILAPVAAAATFAGAMAFGSFEEGGIVPRTGMHKLHETEMVLPDKISTFIQAAVQNQAGGGDGNGGGGGGVHYHAYRGESPDSVRANYEALRRAHRDGQMSLA